jgi:hypothetical protein
LVIAAAPRTVVVGLVVQIALYHGGGHGDVQALAAAAVGCAAGGAATAASARIPETASVVKRLIIFIPPYSGAA